MSCQWKISAFLIFLFCGLTVFFGFFFSNWLSFQSHWSQSCWLSVHYCLPKSSLTKLLRRRESSTLAGGWAKTKASNESENYTGTWLDCFRLYFKIDIEKKNKKKTLSCPTWWADWLTALPGQQTLLSQVFRIAQDVSFRREKQCKCWYSEYYSCALRGVLPIRTTLGLSPVLLDKYLGSPDTSNKTV